MSSFWSPTVGCVCRKKVAGSPYSFVTPLPVATFAKVGGELLVADTARQHVGPGLAEVEDRGSGHAGDDGRRGRPVRPWGLTGPLAA